MNKLVWMKISSLISSGTRWTFLATAVSLILLLPLLAMQFTDQVVWDVADFAIFGALLVGVAGTYELAARKTVTSAYRSAVGVALAAAFCLVWVNLAVGIIGTEGDDASLMFGGVIATGIIGAITARFQPHGMARAMLTTAIVQALVAVIALVSELGSTGSNWPQGLLICTALFVALWLLSAWLFRRAARQKPFSATLGSHSTSSLKKTKGGKR